jgi:DNA segregation ATPase FtsK/SpoIIIE, S-DNA-T family
MRIMAAKQQTRRKRQQPTVFERTADLVVRPEVLGLALIGVALLTLLSLLTDTRGRVTQAWIEFLEQMVGLGAWGVPLVLGAIGIWIIMRAVDQMPDLPWQRPVGISLLFVALVTGFSLVADSTPEEAGGLLGNQIAYSLARSIGGMGAWAVVSLTAAVGLVFLTDRLLADAAIEAWYRWQEWRQSHRERNSVIQPALPIPSGEIPWWKRIRNRFTAVKADSGSPNLVPAHPQRPVVETPRPAAHPPRPSESAAQASDRPRPNAESAALIPHIIGRAQEWDLPRFDDMLNDWDRHVESDDLIRSQGRLIQETLGLFGVPADFEGAYKGPSVTQYLIKPGYVERTVRGEQTRVKIKVSKIASLSNDLALALAAPSVRIEAPVPGTNYVGVEVPNHESNVVGLKELMQSDAFRNIKGTLPIALGEDVKGQPIVADLGRMPHLLIAGATGSGKSVCINSIITCLLLTHTPDTLRLLMIDPKMVELNIYNGTPHLLSPVVTDIDRAAGVLFWAVKEMERRYQLFSQAKARDIDRYNAYLLKRNEKPLPYIVVVVDEMADLMLASPEDVEKHICRLAQMARAVGIHLIVATQRPSVDVITGLIKANFPARIAFAVSSQVDSRVILDVPGADRLLGRGDMLYMPPDASKLERIQGAFLSDEEINRVVRYWRGIHALEESQPSDPEADPISQTEPFSEPITNLSTRRAGDDPPAQDRHDTDDRKLAQPELFTQIERMKEAAARDDLFDDAVRVVQDTGRGSVSLLQRKLRIGYSRSSRLVDQLEEAGILGPDLGGNQGRRVLISAKRTSQTADAPHIIGGEDDADRDMQSPRVWM